jgi:prepilin-type N-terminal cleavage/methylation domain-containing protein
MRHDGFTLVEMLVVIAIMGILLAIATPNWSSMLKKNAVESEIKTLYSDLMELRLNALYIKRSRSAVLSGRQFNVYSSSVTSVAPVTSNTLRFPLAWVPAGPLTLTFDAGGLSTAGEDIAVCVDPESSLAVANPGAVDSLVVSAARIKLGKRQQGGNCDATGSSITLQ